MKKLPDEYLKKVEEAEMTLKDHCPDATATRNGYVKRKYIGLDKTFTMDLVVIACSKCGKMFVVKPDFDVAKSNITKEYYEKIEELLEQRKTLPQIITYIIASNPDANENTITIHVKRIRRQKLLSKIRKQNESKIKK